MAALDRPRHTARPTTRSEGIITRNNANCCGFLVEPSGSGHIRSPREMPRQQGGKAMLVRDVMRKTASVQAEETLEVVALRLKQENVGALPVVEAGQIAGMITDRDILLRGPAGGRSMGRTKAREVMSVGALACHDTDDLDHALGLMSRHRIHRLPVLDGNEKLVGILSVNQFRTPSSEPAAFEVIFYKQAPQFHRARLQCRVEEGGGCEGLIEGRSRPSGDQGIRTRAQGLSLGSCGRRL